MDSETVILDATGLRCPLPVLRARKALRSVAPGGTLTVRTTDPAAPADFEAFCREAGHDFVGVADDGEARVVTMRKGGSAG
jgi:tRNA 2-thiouridine synthesizing protein A